MKQNSLHKILSHFLQTCMTTSLPSKQFIRHPTYTELHLILLPILMSHKGFNEMQICYFSGYPMKSMKITVRVQHILAILIILIEAIPLCLQ